MSVLNDLVAQIEDDNLREKISNELERVVKPKKFGLVFEEHLSEDTFLYDVPVKIGALAAVKDHEIKDVYRVNDIKGKIAECQNQKTNKISAIPVSELVTIANADTPLYPYLDVMDFVCNAKNSNLWNILIEADNYHALQLLEYIYAGKVDCIYIDPPYNTGAKNWKYNNNYTDKKDTYRHSKWLSFMQKRLDIAKKLLNPNKSVLIVTIDEKEYLHLGCLLEEMFPEARMQMITSRINKKASPRVGQFARCDEYLFLLQFGSMSIQKSKYSMLDVTDNSNPDAKEVKTDAIWNSMLRRGANGSSRRESPTLFYPVWIDEKKKRIEFVGSPLPLEADRHDVERIQTAPGLKAVWPIRTDDSEGRWQLGHETLRSYLEQGIAKLGAYNKKREQWAVVYLTKKRKEQLRDGTLIATGKDANGALILEWNDDTEQVKEPKTMWVRDWHDASIYGTNLISKIIPKRKFPYPKSLYAVHDTLEYFVRDNKEALILDFFAGSGTTLHAVNLLNAEDNGHRRCIMITNNEVSHGEAKHLTKNGYHQGDAEWEKLGVVHNVTWPRTVCSIEGHDINGNPLDGNYKGSNIPMSDGFKANAIFLKLRFLDKPSILSGTQFEKLLPMLWMKAKAVNSCPALDSEIPTDMLFLPRNEFAVLLDEKFYQSFCSRLEEYTCIKTVFLVTDSEISFRKMADGLGGKSVYQLYRDYFENFRINPIRNCSM